MMSLFSLLQNPEPEHPLDPEIAHVFLTNREKFNITAREWTLKYAK